MGTSPKVALMHFSFGQVDDISMFKTTTYNSKKLIDRRLKLVLLVHAEFADDAPPEGVWLRNGFIISSEIDFQSILNVFAR